MSKIIIYVIIFFIQLFCWHRYLSDICCWVWLPKEQQQFGGKNQNICCWIPPFGSCSLISEPWHNDNYARPVLRMHSRTNMLRWYIWFVQWGKACFFYLSRIVTKPSKWHVRPAKTQISLGIRTVRSESSLSAWRKLGSLATLLSTQRRLWSDPPSLIWVFAGRTCHFVGFVTMQLI